MGRRKQQTWGEAFAAELKRRGLGHEDAARELESSVGSINNWARGRCLPRDLWRFVRIERWSGGRVPTELASRVAA